MKHFRSTLVGKSLLAVSAGTLTTLCGLVIYVIIPVTEWSVRAERHIRRHGITSLIEQSLSRIRRYVQRNRIIVLIARSFSLLYEDYRMWYDTLAGREDFSDFAE